MLMHLDTHARLNTDTHMHTLARLDTPLWIRLRLNLIFAFITIPPIAGSFARATDLSISWFSDAGGVPQVFLTAPSGTVQIPVSAVQLHQVSRDAFHPAQPSQPTSHLFFLTLGILLPARRKPGSRIRSQEACFPGQGCGGQAGKLWGA